MKKHISFLLMVVVCVVMILPSKISAQTSLNGTNLKIGAWLGEAPTTDAISKFQSLQQRNLDTIMFYIDWSTNFNSIKDSYMNPIYSNGSTAIITWEAWGLSNQDITDGKKDSYIKNMAQSMKSYNKEIWINLMHEANGNWYDWAVGDSKVNTNETYIAAYRHVVNIFRQEGAFNVKFIFCVNSSSCGEGSSFLGHYPGDAYVDMVAMDGYNWGTTQSWGSTWQSFDQIYANCYKTMCQVDKPILITEMSSTETGGNKAQWITDTYKTIRSNYPRIKVVSWFGENKETDWRINSSDASLAAYVAAVKNNSSATETPATSEAPTVTTAPSDTPDISVTASSSGTSSINQNYQISAQGTKDLDLSKLTIRYFFSKAGTKDMTFWCDSAAAQLNVAPWYENISGITVGKVVKSGYQYYVDLTFSDSYFLKVGTGSINIQTRITNSDWSSVENFKEGNLLVLYDGQAVK